MNNIITDIKSLQEETLLNLRNSKSNNTVRAYKSDFKDFGLFCAKNGFKALPSEPKIISLYLTHLSTKEIKISTLKRRLVSIGMIHKLKGHYLDTKHPVIIENLLGIKRVKGSIHVGKKPLLNDKKINCIGRIIKTNKVNKNNDNNEKDNSILLEGDNQYEEMSIDDMWDKFCRVDLAFPYKYAVYHHLFFKN